jgi:hypothetical protein
MVTRYPLPDYYMDGGIKNLGVCLIMIKTKKVKGKRQGRHAGQ